MVRRLCPQRKVCLLGKYAKHRVVGRGDLPCDILILGEAPGRTEDMTGQPFSGPSGRILNVTLEKVQKNLGIVKRIYISNIVQCRPCDGRSQPNRAPTEGEIRLCHSNLEYTYMIAKPQTIVCLGQTAAKACKKAFPHFFTIHHPAFLLRSGGFESAYYPAFYRAWVSILGGRI